MARWNSYIEDNVGDGANTIAGIIANGPTYGIGISSDVYITGIATFTDVVKLDGQLRDGDNNFGSSGQVLSSDGTDTRWINAGELSAGAASQVAVNDDTNTNAERFITLVDSSSGNNNVKTDASLKYNPSTNTITTVNITGNVTGNLTGNVTGNVTGNISGNSGSATVLQTSRTIGGVSFDGSSNINLPGVNQAGNQDTTGNAATATILETTRTIGGVSFNGSANINLPGVNSAGNQNTTGNAATATTLETSRDFSIDGEITANAQSFNGSGDVTLSATVDDNVIDEANLKVSNDPQNGFFLKCNTAVAGGLTWSEVTLPTANTLTGSTLASGITATSITSLGNLTGLTVNGSSSVRDVTIQSGYHLQRSNHHTGHLEGSYNNVGANSYKSNPIYSIGSSYNPNDASLNDFYGIGYTHTNASFISFTGASGWGMYVAADGDARIYLGGSNGVISSTGNHYVGSNRVLHTGDEGHGNGINADTVDDIHGASFLRSDTDDVLTKGSLTTISASLADWMIRFVNNNGTNAYVYMSHGTHGMHIRNDSSSTSTYLLDVYAANGNRFRVRGADALVTSNGNTMWHAGNDGNGSGLDADTLHGASPNVNASNNTIVRRHSSGYIFSNYINTTDNSVSGSVSAIMVKQGDNYHRSANADAVRSFINVASGAAPANVQTFTSSGTWTKPSTGTIANVYMWGGGGGGGGNSNFNGGGGGGGYAEYNIPLSDLGSTVSVTVGGGGGVNNDGGTSQFGSTNYAAGGGETGHNGTNYETNGYGGSGGSPRGVGTGGNRGFYTSGTTDDGTTYYNNTGAESTEDGHSGGGGGSAAGGGPSSGGHAYMAGGGGGARRYGSTSSGGNSYGGGNGGSGNNNGSIPAGGGGARASGGRGLVRVVVV